MEYSKIELIKFLSLANIKLKKIRRNLKNVRIERNYYKNKLQQIEEELRYIDKYDYYDHPDKSQCDVRRGELQVKEDILRIINRR